ncbi:MAG: hypothetical protein H0T89_35625 [Deltaproteobacteria bacterium]|nr:hypothetical protein [Deltaproteobacteria bacterium]MDQ3296571.1 hypothetical protein [Myxococcota bacterium]
MLRAASALAVVSLLALAGCGKRDRNAAEDRSQAARPRPAGPLGVVAEVRGEAMLVGDAGRFALIVERRRWFDAAGGALRERPELSAPLARTLADLEPFAEVHLGSAPVVVGGEEHHEQHIRLEPAPRPIAVTGIVVEIAMAGPGEELWRTEHELRTELASFDGQATTMTTTTTMMTTTPIPALLRIGPDANHRSPVQAKLCAQPRIIDLVGVVTAGAGSRIDALVTECNDATPIRIVSYRWPGPRASVTTLASPAELGFRPERLVVTPRGEAVVVGTRAGQLAIGRVGTDHQVTVTTTLAGVSRVTTALAAVDASIWTLTLGASDDWIVARDGVAVTLVDPTGSGDPEQLQPLQLASAPQLGIVVLARSATMRYLLATQPPAGPPLVITAR